MSHMIDERLVALLENKINLVLCQKHSENHQHKIIFPGAFNPWHDGHHQMATIASELLSEIVTLEISIINVDKPPLDFDEIKKRASSLPASQHYCVTRAASFVEKAKVFPGVVFVVGIDTLVRISDSKYYDNRFDLCEQAILEIAEAGCRFLVFGRELNGTYLSLANAKIPAKLQTICIEVPEATFRHDISSSNLRGRG